MATLSTTRIIRATELAERLSISRVTLWRWERAGRLPKKHVVGPNVTGWLEQEIDEWWEARSTGSPEGEARDGEERSRDSEESEPPKFRVVSSQEGS